MINFQYGAAEMTFQEALFLADGTLKGELNRDTQAKIESSYRRVQNVVASGKTVYGVNTGFGSLCTTLISKEETSLLQSNLLKSHSTGVGAAVSEQITRLMLVLKIHALAKGFSGIAPATVARLMWHVEQKVTPIVPSQGSLGASGDLAPLSHLFLPLLGLGKVMFEDKMYNAADILQKFNLEPLELQAKEGLALINGTQFMAAHAVLITAKLKNCLDNADIIGALMVEALKGSAAPFDADLHRLRPYAGTIHVAHRLFELLRGSDILISHANCAKVQDPYSLRCMPQVHGASRNAWLHLKETVHTEINSVTDNPIVFSENKIVSGGNFHGQPIALPLDYAALAASEVGSISERRIYLSLEGKTDGVPKLLMSNTGLNSGFMILQYTAAALASENKSLCFPASADSIPSSLGQEDHVSMGSISGRKALQITENVEYILALELMHAAQGIDFHRPMKSSAALDACHDKVRQQITFADRDRIYTDDIAAAKNLVANGDLVKIANNLIGKRLASEFERKF